MEKIIEIAFSQVNITLTILVLLLIAYWLFTIFSGLDFDVDFDVDIDIDADIDVDADADISGSEIEFSEIANTELRKEHVAPNRKKKLKWWQIVLVFFNFVGLPFMFTFTAWVFIWWICVVIATSLTHSYSNVFGFVLFLAAIIPSLFLTKIFTTPFKGFFDNLNKDGDEPIDLIGRKGVMYSSISNDKMGSAEVLAEGTPMSIYVKSLNGTPLKYKDDILIIKQSDDKNYYLVEAYVE